MTALSHNYQSPKRRMSKSHSVALSGTTPARLGHIKARQNVSGLHQDAPSSASTPSWDAQVLALVLREGCRVSPGRPAGQWPFSAAQTIICLRAGPGRSGGRPASAATQLTELRAKLSEATVQFEHAYTRLVCGSSLIRLRSGQASSCIVGP